VLLTTVKGFIVLALGVLPIMNLPDFAVQFPCVVAVVVVVTVVVLVAVHVAVLVVVLVVAVVIVSDDCF
jgi:hypothetical protein